MVQLDSRKIILVAIVLSVLLLTGFATSQRKTTPIRKEDLIRALKHYRRGDPQKGIRNEVRLRGVDFELTSADKIELRKAGANRWLIAAVRNGFRRQVTPAMTASPTPTPTLRRANIEWISARIAWEQISSSKNPEDFLNYLQKFPNGSNTDDARARLKELKNIRVQVGMELVWIAPGSFMMGSENGFLDEKPVHRVTMSNGFYLGKYEVTFAEWSEVMGDISERMKDLDSKFKQSKRQPVVRVSWNDAQEFIRKLNALGDGYTYRLPTEAEWEYACRAGTTGDYAGDLDVLAWHEQNSKDQTYAVGQKPPNGFGLHDMHGNVWEWCEDWYHENYNGAPTDGSAWSSGGKQQFRVLRGGSFTYSRVHSRSAHRRGDRTPSYNSGNIGFRLVAVPRSDFERNNISVRQVEDVTILDMDGTITIGESTVRLRSAIKMLLGEGEKKILLNLAGVSFIDSSGIGELVSSYTAIGKQGGQLKLLNLTKKVKDLLTITKLLTTLDVYENEADALASFR